MLHYDPELDEDYEIDENTIINCPPLEAAEVARLFHLPLEVIEAYLDTDLCPSPEGADAFYAGLQAKTE